MTHRWLGGVCAAFIMAATFGGPVFAQKPMTTCPAGPSGWMLVDRDTWWAITVAGFETEGIPVYDEFGAFTSDFDEFSAALGFTDGAALEEFVRYEQWAEIDRNQNDLVCMKVLPQTPGIPAWGFGGMDDQASTKRGQGGS